MGLHHLSHGIYFIIPFDKVNIQPLKLQKKDIRKRKSSADFIDRKKLYCYNHLTEQEVF